MRSLALLFRSKTSLPCVTQLVRGPKKKKEAQLKVESNDIINIFKDRQDPELKPISQYPVYVQQFSLGAFSFYQLYDGVQYNIPYKYPSASTFRSYLTAIKRQKCKYQNQYIHIYRDPSLTDETKDLNKRTMVLNVFGKTKEEEDEEFRKQQEELLEDDEDDEE